MLLWVTSKVLTFLLQHRKSIGFCLEFGEDAGKYALIVCALYGGKHAGRDYWLYLRKCMTDLGFESCYADPDVWFRESTNKHGKDVYEYVLLYTDDCLVISKDGMHII